MKKMLSKVKEWNQNALKFTHNNIEYFIAPLIIALILTLFYQWNSRSAYIMPKTPDAFAKASIMILHKNLESGGSGVILKSNKSGSIILTNKHVCKLTKNGGFTHKDGLNMLVQAFKEYPYHDLCLIKVAFNYKVTTKVSDETPDMYSPAFISGHPLLLPHVLTAGNFSGFVNINVLTGFKKCKDENDTEEEDLLCRILGKIPIIENFDSQLVTGTILPGSSGSGVFDDEGKISGLVFAGRGGGLAYAFIVPHAYVSDFIENQNQYKWTKSNFNLYDSFNEDLKKLKSICINIKEKHKELHDICTAAYRRQIL